MRYPDHSAAMKAPNELIKLLEDSQRRLEREYAAIATEERQVFRRRRLRQLLRTVSKELEAVKREAQFYLTEVFPSVYAAGGQSVIADFAWTTVARSAVQVLAQSTFDQVLTATQYMEEDAKRWVRQNSRRIALQGQFEGSTTKQLAKRFAELAPRAVAANGLPLPITAITYADGSVRTLSDYGRMLFRTDTAKAYNAGVINTAEEVGIFRFEIFDGPDCGLTSHDDPQKANGLIVDAATARAYSISHPNCRRSFGASLSEPTSTP